MLDLGAGRRKVGWIGIEVDERGLLRFWEGL
jgi:hypothetical protein